MRVLSLVPSPGSTSYSRRIAALERCGVECTTLSPAGEHRPDGPSRSVVDYAALYPRALRASLDGYDLVHAVQGAVAPLALAQPTRPIVLSLWGTDLFGRLGPVSRWCARRASAVVVMSPEMARALGRDAHVLPHGVDLERFRPRDQGAARADLGWDADAAYVLFPYSEARTVKNYPRATRVVSAARERVDRPVRFETVSGVAHERVATYMNAADALLLTSDHEGSPNTVKEALACNLPLVSTDVGDVKRRLDGVSPSAVCRNDRELVDALVSVLRRGDRSNGRTAVRELPEDRQARRLKAVYEDVIGGA
jgi:glycosyltransferase involved in cell wall biosynthesis